MATTKGGSKAKSRGGANRGKPGIKQGLKDLQAKDAKGIRGGRKAGEKPVEYMKITMKEVIIT